MPPAAATKGRAAGLGENGYTQHGIKRWTPLGAVGAAAGSGGHRWERSRPLGAEDTAGSGPGRWERAVGDAGSGWDRYR